MDEETFKLIYSQFFPQGSESGTPEAGSGGCRYPEKMPKYQSRRVGFTCSRLPPLADASTYAHFLFDAFDADRNGALCFQVRLPALLPHPASPSQQSRASAALLRLSAWLYACPAV